MNRRKIRFLYKKAETIEEMARWLEEVYAQDWYLIEAPNLTSDLCRAIVQVWENKSQ